MRLACGVSQSLTGQLTVVLIDNGGGGIFEQLPIRPSRNRHRRILRLFSPCPSGLDTPGPGGAHGVPSAAGGSGSNDLAAAPALE